MYLRKFTRRKDGKPHIYWGLVESHRTERGPRQRVVSYLGELDATGCVDVRLALSGDSSLQLDAFKDTTPEWVEVNLSGVHTERTRDFGDLWLALSLLKRLGLVDFFRRVIPRKRGKIPWSDMALILVLARFCHPSSELHIAEHFYGQTALPDVFGIPEVDVYDTRLYRALDRLLPHKVALERHLRDRFKDLFDVRYDLLLYDLTSTYFEGQAAGNPQAKRGYSRDKRSDCKQVCIALVVTREGIPLSYEVFDGNRSDVTTVEEMVSTIEARFGRAERVWVMDRGMSSEDNLDFLKADGRRYIIGSLKNDLKQFGDELRAPDWDTIRDGIEVKLCPDPAGSDEVFILCRSADRRQKDKAILDRFIQRLEAGLERLQSACEAGRVKQISVAERRIGRLLQANSRAARLFHIEVKQTDDNGRLKIEWSHKESNREWAVISQGCYVLRSNIMDWSAPELWQAYMQLTEAEAAFRIHKSDLELRPVWHQRPDRVQAHILVCFLAYVLWKSLAQFCKLNGLGNEPRKIIQELAQIKVTDVVLPTRSGLEVRLQCVTKPEPHQQILLQKLGLKLPKRLTQNLKM
jgi:transposase